MGRGYRDYDDVWSKLEELRQIRSALCDLIGTDDNNVILRWIEEEKNLRHPCPGKFLLGLTKPKQESAIKTWTDFSNTLKRKGVSKKNIDYLLDKLSLESTIEDAITSFERLSTEKKDFNDLKNKRDERTFTPLGETK